MNDDSQTEDPAEQLARYTTMHQDLHVWQRHLATVRGLDVKSKYIVALLGTAVFRDEADLSRVTGIGSGQIRHAVRLAIKLKLLTPKAKQALLGTQDEDSDT